MIALQVAPDRVVSWSRCRVFLASVEAAFYLMKRRRLSQVGFPTRSASSWCSATSRTRRRC